MINQWLKRLTLTLLLLIAVAVGAFIFLFSKALFPREYVNWTDTLRPFVSVQPSTTRAPVVIVLAGCGGQDDRTKRERLQRFSEAGFYVATVDSLTPRSLSQVEVCNGRALWGKERTIDVGAILDILSEDPNADTEHFAVVGYSHGAWTALELLAEPWQGPVPSAVVAFYPFCGYPISLINGWYRETPIKSFLASEDVTTPPYQCTALFETASAEQQEKLDWVMYDGAVHSFDVHDRPDWSGHYNATFAEDSWDQTIRFLQQQLLSSN